MSTQAVYLADALAEHLYQNLADASMGVMKYSRKTTLKRKHVEGAVGLVLSGDLVEHAVAGGNRACHTFVNQA